ncbi:UNVERIFIED_CONTAM: hypothetical protein Cloal_2404 [Acetivibrio alkalicellulosi]
MADKRKAKKEAKKEAKKSPGNKDMYEFANDQLGENKETTYELLRQEGKKNKKK